MPRHVRIEDEDGQQAYDDPAFVIVTGDHRHIWVGDEYFWETGFHDDVTVGDVFYDHEGADKVFQVIDIDESNTGLEVEIEYLYREGQSELEASSDTDRVSLALLRGEEADSMGAGAPPIPLERVE